MWRPSASGSSAPYPSDPQANTQFAGELATLRPALVDGGSAIDDWGKANC